MLAFFLAIIRQAFPYSSTAERWSKFPPLEGIHAEYASEDVRCWEMLVIGQEDSGSHRTHSTQAIGVLLARDLI